MVDHCWLCESRETVYTDVLGLLWCRKDFDETYLGGV